MEVKQVIIIRKDLKMSKGKMIAQACHAAVSAAEIARKTVPDLYKRWLAIGQKKVVLSAASLEELEDVESAVRRVDSHVAVAKIRDAGLTELEPGTITALGIGPHSSPPVEKITSTLKLL